MSFSCLYVIHQVVCPGHVVHLSICHTSSNISRSCRSLVYISCIKRYVQAMSFSRPYVICCVICPGHVVLSSLCHTLCGMSRPCCSLAFMSYVVWYVQAMLFSCLISYVVWYVQAMSFSCLYVIHCVVCPGHVVLLSLCHMLCGMSRSCRSLIFLYCSM